MSVSNTAQRLKRLLRGQVNVHKISRGHSQQPRYRQKVNAKKPVPIGTGFLLSGEYETIVGAALFPEDRSKAESSLPHEIHRLV